MKYYAVFVPSDGYHSLCFDFPVLSYGEDFDKAVESTRSGIVEYIADCKSRNKPIPEPASYDVVLEDTKNNPDLTDYQIVGIEIE